MYIIHLIGKANNWGWIKITLKASSLCHVFVGLHTQYTIKQDFKSPFDQFKNETFLVEPLDIYKL